MKKILLLAATFLCFINLTNAQPGQLDPSFGINGIVKTDLGKNYNNNNLSLGSQVLVQPDGSIYFIVRSGNAYLAQALITKRHPDGSTDSSYGHNGFSDNVKMAPSSAILQPDGKIVVAGSVDRLFNSYDIALARFNTDGSLDSSFNDDGIQTNFGFGSYTANPLVIQNNEKIVVCAGFVIARYNSDGNPDSTFNTTGILYDGFDSTYGDFTITGGAVQKDSKIVTAGTYGGNQGDSSVYFVKRYNTDGSPDKTFGKNGIQITHLNSVNSFPNSVAINKDGKILVGGGTLVRYNTDGSLDSSFSGDGIATTDFYVSYYSYQGYSLNLQNDEKIVVTGNTGNESNPNFIIARYNTNGRIDNTFSGDGIVTNKFITSSAAIQQDGKIIIGGSDNSNFALARYTANGTSDNTFDKDGKLTDSLQSGYTIFKSSAFQKDGKLVAAGRTWNGSNFDFAIARYNTDGSPDKTFSSDGAQTTDFGSKDDVANSVAIQSDGKIIVAGNSGSTNISIARYNTDGSLDNTFNIDPKLKNAFSETGDKANSVAIQSDGKIVIVGTVYDDGYSYEGNVFAVARLNVDGSLDKTFDKDGKQTFVFSDNDGPQAGFATSVAIQKDGKIVVGGISGGYDAFISVGRLNTDGSLDNTFGDGGKANGGDYSDQTSMSIVIQTDGKIVAAGYSYYRGNSDNFISRFDTNGKLDSSFSNDGKELTSLENNPDVFSDFGNLVAIQSDGKIVVSGAALTRYSANGTLDSTFGNNGIQATPIRENNVFINSIAIADNKLYGVGFGISPGNVGLVARYLLYSSSTPPTVSLTTPTDNTTRLAPAAHIKLSAAAADKDGIITKVEFYNGTTLLHTETVFPYGFVWRNVPLGNYTITAKAYDNSGNVTTSAPVHISVVPNKAPVVSIVKPSNNRNFAAPAYIHFEAAASDADGRITRVQFYNGSTLLRTEFKYPYTYVWKNIPAGSYTITAVATDNWGAHTTSAPVIVNVTNAMIVSSKPFAENEKTALNDALHLKVYPNPATDAINIAASGLQQDKQTTISVISAGGIVMKTLQMKRLNQLQLDVSTLASGVYTIKLVSGDKVSYAKFVKL